MYYLLMAEKVSGNVASLKLAWNSPTASFTINHMYVYTYVLYLYNFIASSQLYIHYSDIVTRHK